VKIENYNDPKGMVMRCTCPYNLSEVCRHKTAALLNLQDKSDNLINDYVMKESSKRFFNKNRLSGMVRVGYGHISLFGSYQFTQLFKDGAGPIVRPYTIGLNFSGL